MDIWAWVIETQRSLEEQGHGRLAQLMEDLPRAALADENDDVEAMVPEALGLARSLHLPWVEIFVRHWYRQSRTGGFAELPDAIELLEFSHREEHRACPQSVCTVQDVAIAYGGADGPGFAQERLDVSRETLERIDPTWPCFTCISAEYASALDDAGRPEEALEFLREQRAALAAVGHSDPTTELLGTEAEALLSLGRYEEVLERMDFADRARPREDDSFARYRRLRRARALMGLGRADEARDVLLDYELVEREPNYAREWVEVMHGLVDAGLADNDWRLGSGIEHLLRAVADRGRAWDAVLVAAGHGDLALERGAVITARHALEVLREQAGLLRDPARAADRIERLEAALAEPRPEIDLPDDPDALIEALDEEEDPDPEEHVERLDAGRRRFPDDLRLVMALAAALDALGRPGASASVLREFADAHPEERTAQLRYGFALLDAGDMEALESLAARLEPDDPADADWLRANRAIRTGDSRAAAELAARVVEADPEARNARRLWARACEDLGDFEQALTLWSEVIGLTPEDEDAGYDHWMRMVAASATGDWRTLRESAAVLEMELGGEPDSPPDERWEYIRLRYDARDIVIAGRIGPVTARVLEISHPSRPQHVDDVVVYYPDLLEQPTEDAPALAQVVKVIEEGGVRSFELDGVHPGDAHDAFVEGLVEAGLMLDVRSGDAYELQVDGETRRGIYGFLGVPRDMDDATAHARLTELLAPLPHPVVCIDLAEAAGDSEAAARQRAIAEELQL